MSRPIDSDILKKNIENYRTSHLSHVRLPAIKREAEEVINDICFAIDCAPTVRSELKWIPASERLPEPDNVYKDDPTYYLVQNEYGDMMVAKFIKFPGGARVWQQIHQYGAIMEDIVAWMPRPKPWKGGKHEVN